MGMDSITEVTTQSWGSRLKNSIGGIIFGLIMIVGAFALLFWNEGRAVKRAKALEEGATSVISIFSVEVNPANQGKLVHTTGSVATQEVLKDSEFPIEANAVKLRRSCEMYQWEETKKTKTKEETGGKKKTTTTYSYAKDWSSSTINSSNFNKPSGHQNPGHMPYTGQSWLAEQVQLGAFRLNGSQVAQLSGYQQLSLDTSFLNMLPTEERDRARLNGNELYISVNGQSHIGQPEVGDMRIWFDIVPPGQTISLVAQQEGDSFVPYVARSGSEIELLSNGTKTAEEMFSAAKRSNTIMTWLIRLGGFFLMFIGFRTIMNPIRTLAAVLPFLARIVGFGLSLISFLLAITLSLITIAIAWFVYRPILSGVLIAVSVAILVAVKFLRKPEAA